MQFFRKMKFQSKDFIETREGLAFAVVSEKLCQGRVLCFLRYVKTSGEWKKIATDQANQLLTENFPYYLHYSEELDAQLHGVTEQDIVIHHQPVKKLAFWLRQKTSDPVIADLQKICSSLSDYQLLMNQIGVTGSLLLGVQQQQSDIDLVIYDRSTFDKVRQVIQELIKAGVFHNLSKQDWLLSFQRRDCDLSFEEYVWHEQRKNNKFLLNDRKVDLNLLVDEPGYAHESFIKQKMGKWRATVLDDRFAFDYPARYRIDNQEAPWLLSFTATYTGQAKKGEIIEVCGHLEKSGDGRQQIVVGSTREARGEYIKVVSD